jgi:hypothetical protein
MMFPLRVVPPPLPLAPLERIMTPLFPACRMFTRIVVRICKVVRSLDGHDIYPSVAVYFLLMSYAVFYLVSGQVL